MNDNLDKALRDLLFDSLKEQRRRRRWSIFFKLIWVILLGMAIVTFWDSDEGAKIGSEPHTALIDIRGVIADGGEVNADQVASSLNAAFNDKGTKGIILRINSPGGSPVQSSYIFNEVQRLSSLHPGIKVYAVCTDICASGGYYIAASAYKIYANQSSLVGSIGVIMNGFGFVDAMQKLGISRRLFTAGEHKGFLDPYSPIKPEEKQILDTLLKTLHTQFIESVKKGRGNRLKLSDPTLFSGLAWTGVQAKDLGLVDDFGSTGYVAREVIKEEKIFDYTVKPNFFERISGRVGVSAGEGLAKQLGLSQTNPFS